MFVRRRYLWLFPICVIAVGAIFFILNMNQVEGRFNHPAETAVVDYLEGAKSFDAARLLSSIKDTTFSSEEKRIEFYTKDIRINRLIDYQIVDIRAKDATNAIATVKLNVSTMGKFTHDFKLVKEHDKWFVWLPTK